MCVDPHPLQTGLKQTLLTALCWLHTDQMISDGGQSSVSVNLRMDFTKENLQKTQ